MSSALFAFENIHTGLWTDYTHGHVQGLSLTTTAQQGIYLIAILALARPPAYSFQFVRFAGSQSWDLLRCAWFHIRNRQEFTDALFQQQQALLQNEATDTSAILRFAEVSWAWRNRSTRPLLRGLPFIITGFLHFLAFAAAGIFSSKVVAPHSDVLLLGSVCGFWGSYNESTNQEYLTETAYLGQWMRSNWRVGEKFATNCYNFDSPLASSNTSCLAPGKALIPWTVSNASCPFQDGLCADGKAVALDTGYFDSHMVLGINAPLEHRVTYRLLTECAPLATEGYVEEFTDPRQSPPTAFGLDTNSSDLLTANTTYYGFLYGENPDWQMNYTWVFNGNRAFGENMGNIVPPFMVYASESLAGSDIANFIPIPALNRTDGDVYIIYVMNNDIGYLGPSHDPIFGATVPQVEISAFNGKRVDETFYFSQSPVSVLGCVQRIQWCNPKYGPNNCTQLIASLNNNVDMLHFNSAQRYVASRISNAFARADWRTMMINLGAEGLLATSEAGTGFGANPLPDDQWIRELSHWYATWLSAAQVNVARYVTGSGNAQMDSYLTKWTNENATWMCDAQIVQRDDYYTFNMLGMLWILIGGGTLIIVNSLTMCCVEQTWPAARKKKPGFEKSAWGKYDQLRLQSKVYQAMGLGNWTDDESVPVLDRDSEIFPAPSFSGQEREVQRDNYLGPIKIAESSMPMLSESEIRLIGTAI